MMNPPLKKARIVLSTGGTGGHVFPALSLGQELSERGHFLLWCIDQRGISYLPSSLNFQESRLKLEIIKGKGVWGLFYQALTMLTATFRVLKAFRGEKPDLIIGFGGYTTAPVMIAAFFYKIPFILHEANAVLGRVNRWIARYSSGLTVGFEKTKRIPQGITPFYTGNPLRDTLKNHPITYPPLGDRINILVLGGSQGASLFSTIIPAALALLPPEAQSRIEITQQARPEWVESTQKSYDQLGIPAIVQPFFKEMGLLYARSHLVICRSGAMTVTEIQATCRPALFIPLAIATDNHQYFNADSLRASHSGWLMEEKEVTPLILASYLQKILENPEMLTTVFHTLRQKFSPDATVTLANYVEDLLTKRQ